MYRIVLLALAFSSVAAAKPRTAPALDVVRLGDVDLRDAKDWDRINLGPCRGTANVKVTKLGVRVTKHPAQIDKLGVEFWNGEKQELTVRHRFTPGSESRWIDLSGEARCIKSIRIIGDTDSIGWRPGKQAQVAFWGKK